MNQQQKKWEKEQKRRQAKKERAAEGATHEVKDGAGAESAAPAKTRETSFAGGPPMKVARHQAPVKPVHKQGTQRGG